MCYNSSIRFVIIGDEMDNQQRSLKENIVKHKEYNILVSNLGVIYNLNKTRRYMNINKQGYLIIQVRVNGLIKTLKVHRLVAETFLEDPPQELVEKCSKEHWGKVLVLHNDNDKLNNRINNLRWGSLEDNTLQAFGDGLINPRIGTLNGRAILDEATVHKLCVFFESNGTPKQAVEKFNVSIQQASKIRCGIAWKHISCQYDIKPLKKRSTTSREA